jgi:putative peptide zinc metalloprotease protein
MKGNLFSESWYKVAELQVGLLNSVHIQKQYYRGKLWYVLQDSFNYNYYRIDKETYGFVARMTPDKTVEQVWEECLEVYQEDAPSQDDVIKLLSQLHLNNLLYFRNLPNNEFIFERHLEKKGRQIKTKLLSIISIKIPLWNPDRFLDRILPLIRTVFSLKGAVIWAVVVVLGAKAILDHATEVYDQTQGILSQSNLIYLYLSLAVMKFAHEMGHAAISKCFGRPVYSMGIMFLVFTPLPFMDATTSWFLQNRWKRVLVGSAGMMVDLFLAAVAALIWSNTGDGLVHSIAFNMMMVGSISSIFFNGNPLLRFDAYYILTDLLQIPNLYQRSRMQWQYWLEKYIFAIKDPVSPSDGVREAIWLALYALASLIYRWFDIAICFALPTSCSPSGCCWLS